MGINRNAIIGFPRWTQELELSGGTWEESYPVENLGRLPLSRVARSVGLGPLQTRFTAILRKSRPIQILGLIRHNFSRSATIRIRIFADISGQVLLHDETLDAWPVVYPVDQLAWESDSFWDGRYSEDEMSGYSWTRPILLPKVMLARRIDFLITDLSNPNGYIDIGMVEVAQGWQLGVNFDWDASYGFDFRSTSTRALGGADHFTQLDKPRVFQGQVTGLDRGEAMSQAFELHRQMDLCNQFLWMPDPGEPLHWLRTVFLARNSNPGLLRYAHVKTDTIPLSFIEVIES